MKVTFILTYYDSTVKYLKQCIESIPGKPEILLAYTEPVTEKIEIKTDNLVSFEPGTELIPVETLPGIDDIKEQLESKNIKLFKYNYYYNEKAMILNKFSFSDLKNKLADVSENDIIFILDIDEAFLYDDYAIKELSNYDKLIEFNVSGMFVNIIGIGAEKSGNGVKVNRFIAPNIRIYNKKKARFRYRCKEILEFTEPEPKLIETDFLVKHYGYNSETLPVKINRNLQLLALDLYDEPSNTYLYAKVYEHCIAYLKANNIDKPVQYLQDYSFLDELGTMKEKLIKYSIELKAEPVQEHLLKDIKKTAYSIANNVLDTEPVLVMLEYLHIMKRLNIFTNENTMIKG